MTRIRKLIHEVHRRSLWQVLSIYLVGSWIGYQVILNLTQGMGLPAWVPPFAVVLFIIGLPVVLATAFVQEGLPSNAATPRTGLAERRAAGATSHDAARPQATRPEPSAGAPPDRGTARGARDHWLFTWQRAVLGGVVAFLLLGVTAGGYMGARNAGIGPFAALIAAGKLAERDRLLVADFGSGDADVELADALTQAFRIDLAQTPVVNIVEPGHVRELLQRMGRSGAERLDAELARDAALRDGIAAIVVGDVSRAGRGFVLTASIVAAGDRSILAAFRETAADSAAVIAAVDRLSRRVRERIGESLRTVNRSAALPAVTTTSLEALRRYARGVHALDRELDYDAAVRHLEEAIAIDSTFGMAWRKLAVAHHNFLAGRDRIAHASRKAYELRERMSPREREHAAAFHHINVAGDDAAAIHAYLALLDEYPDDHTALHNAGVLYSRSSEPERAIEYYRRAIVADSSRPSTHTNLAGTYVQVGQLNEAEALLLDYERRFGVSRAALMVRYQLEAARRNYDAAAEAARSLRELRRGDPVLRGQSEAMLGDLHVLHGQLAVARRHRQEAAAAETERDSEWMHLRIAAWDAFTDVLVRGQPRDAVARLERVVAAYPPDRYAPLDRPYRELAEAYALAGALERAHFWLAELERAVPPENRLDERIDRTRSEGILAFAAGDLPVALRHFEQLGEIERCRSCATYWRARTLDALGDERAIAEYEAYLVQPGWLRFHSDIDFMPAVHERLAELYAERGDAANAARHAAIFVELWQEADAELQPRVAAKRALLRSLNADR